MAAVEPLQLHSVTSAAPPDAAGRPAERAVGKSGNDRPSTTTKIVVMAKFHDVTALVERIPGWAHSAAEWLSPRPLTQLLDRNILKASL